MINLIVYAIIFYMIYKSVKENLGSAYSLLNKVFLVQQFSNISNVYSTSSLSIIRADKSGENYVFGVKKDGTSFTIRDIEKIYAIAQGLHIHTIVIAVKTIFTINAYHTTVPVKLCSIIWVPAPL